jgi:hypothetical protein
MLVNQRGLVIGYNVVSSVFQCPFGAREICNFGINVADLVVEAGDDGLVSCGVGTVIYHASMQVGG